jgi:hypothetical protein
MDKADSKDLLQNWRGHTEGLKSRTFPYNGYGHALKAIAKRCPYGTYEERSC